MGSNKLEQMAAELELATLLEAVVDCDPNEVDIVTVYAGSRRALRWGRRGLFKRSFEMGVLFTSGLTGRQERYAVLVGPENTYAIGVPTGKPLTGLRPLSAKEFLRWARAQRRDLRPELLDWFIREPLEALLPAGHPLRFGEPKLSVW